MRECSASRLMVRSCTSSPRSSVSCASWFAGQALRSFGFALVRYSRLAEAAFDPYSTGRIKGVISPLFTRPHEVLVALPSRYKVSEADKRAF